MHFLFWIKLQVEASQSPQPALVCSSCCGQAFSIGLPFCDSMPGYTQHPRDSPKDDSCFVACRQISKHLVAQVLAKIFKRKRIIFRDRTKLLRYLRYYPENFGCTYFKLQLSRLSCDESKFPNVSGYNTLC